MSLPVKAYSASDSDKPPKYWLPVKNREPRSQKPEVHYQISDHDTTLELPKSAEKPDNSFSSEGETLANLNASQLPGVDGTVFLSPSGVPIVYELASLVPKTTTHTSVVHADSAVTSVSTSIGLIPTAPPTATTLFFSSDTTNVALGPTATGPSIYLVTDHIGHTDHTDHTDYYCKKLNSLKHLVRTTVAQSHN